MNGAPSTRAEFWLWGGCAALFALLFYSLLPVLTPFIVGAVLTILYLLRVFTMVFLGAWRGELSPDAREGSPVMVFSVVLLAALALAAGILVRFPTEFVHGAVVQMMGS